MPCGYLLLHILADKCKRRQKERKMLRFNVQLKRQSQLSLTHESNIKRYELLHMARNKFYFTYLITYLLTYLPTNRKAKQNKNK